MNSTIIGVAALLLSSAAFAEESGTKWGRPFAAVNGEVIQCDEPTPLSEEQQARQFDTAPIDLNELSRQAKAFVEQNNEAAVAWRSSQALRLASDWPFLCRYRDANAAIEESGLEPQVVFIGDSITEGWIVADREFFNENGFIGRGISGQSSAQMVARFHQDVVALQPKVVHIMTGTNDIGGATGPITEKEYIGYVRAMIDMAQANRIQVVIAAMPPMTMLLPRPEFDVKPWVRQMNTLLEQTAAQYGATFVDYYTPLADNTGAFDTAYANDGVHPTRIGYAVMKPLAERAIETALGKVAPESAAEHIP
jgi:lysophospholipase L1-like esterase